MTMIVLSLLLLFGSNIASSQRTSENWYKRYQVYPTYCSAPGEMKTRGIPPLAALSGVPETRLVHVTAVIRHGARTPYSSSQTCWDGFWDSDETGVWDCDLNAYLSPPSPRVINDEEGTTDGGGSDAMFLFEKKYNALRDPMRNFLNGTCQLGQLILRGYDQEIVNGEHLRSAYVFDGTNEEHDRRMRLLDLSDTTNPPYLEPVLRYRSDDDERTLLSGQIMLRGLFGTEFVNHLQSQGSRPIIPLHTADRDRDILGPDPRLCPRLDEVANLAQNSPEYQEYINSKDVLWLKQFMRENLGSDNIGLDCLMTTICTDRTLPDAIDDFDHHGDNEQQIFRRIADLNTREFTFVAKFNDAEYSKLGIGPLWAEIMDQVTPILESSDDDQELSALNRLTVISGHDGTIIPLLASLDPDLWEDSEWPAYASMMLLEIHEFVDSSIAFHNASHGFRLLYNGKVLTSLMAGCPKDQELCDIGVLLDRVWSFATRNTTDSCSVSPGTGPSALLVVAKTLWETPGGITLIVVSLLLSGIMGGLIVACFLKREAILRRRRRNVGYQPAQTNGGSEDSPPEAPTLMVI